MSTTAISIRLDSEIKQQFDELCKEFGLSSSTAFNIFARTVVRQKAIPFPISIEKVDEGTPRRSLEAQNALSRIQSISAQEEHEWTNEEIDELITAYRQNKNKP